MSHQNHHQLPTYATDPNTMFVQADPSNFRNIVQKLTGASPPELSAVSAARRKLPLTPKKPAFKLHERRQTSKKMKLEINNITDDSLSHFNRGFLVSPVSHLDPFWTRVSPHSAREYPHPTPDNKEQKAIAEKGFYFLPSPRSGAEPAPELLPLFPLRSLNATNQRTEEDYRNS